MQTIKNQGGFLKMDKKKINFILTMILVFAMGLGARSVNDLVQVVIARDVQVSLNGELQNLRTVEGEKVHPIIHEGTSYLPVRAIAELAGLDVDWDAESGTVLLSKNELIDEEEELKQSVKVDLPSLDGQTIRYLRFRDKEGVFGFNVFGAKGLTAYEIKEKIYFTDNGISSLLNLVDNKINGTYTIHESNNPFLNGLLNIENTTYYNIRTFSKYLDIKTAYTEGYIYKSDDETKKYNWTLKPNKESGVLFYSGRLWFPLDEVLEFYGYKDKINIEYDKELEEYIFIIE